MGAWKKQAVPLVFLEVGVNAIKAEDEADPSLLVIKTAFEHALSSCWSLLNEKDRQISGRDAMRITTKAAKKIQDALISDIWGIEPIKCIGEVTNAMMAIAEDTYAQLPNRGPQDASRLGAWSLMIDVCGELCLLTHRVIGTEEEMQAVALDDRCYGIALKIADLVRAEANS